MITDKPTRLPVAFKPSSNERVLLREHEVPAQTCSHLRCVVDPKLADVTCNDCGERINPIWLLTRMANDDRRYAESRSRHQQEAKRLAERSRTKCEHCNRMTRISRR